MYVLHFKLGYSKNIFLVGRISVGRLSSRRLWSVEREVAEQKLCRNRYHILFRGLPNFFQKFSNQQTWVDQ